MAACYAVAAGSGEADIPGYADGEMAMEWAEAEGYTMLGDSAPPDYWDPEWVQSRATVVSGKGGVIFGHDRRQGLFRWSEESGSLRMSPTLGIYVQEANFDGTLLALGRDFWSACSGFRSWGTVLKELGVDHYGLSVASFAGVYADGTRWSGFMNDRTGVHQWRAVLLEWEPPAIATGFADTNNNGRIDRDDGVGLVGALLGPSAWAACPAGDLDGNNTVDLHDYVLFQRLVDSQTWSDPLDMTRDGVIDERDVRHAIYCMAEAPWDRGCHADLNDDGEIDLRDFAAFQRLYVSRDSD